MCSDVATGDSTFALQHTNTLVMSSNANGMVVHVPEMCTSV
jgi:hypothetical protein